ACGKPAPRAAAAPSYETRLRRRAWLPGTGARSSSAEERGVQPRDRFRDGVVRDGEGEVRRGRALRDQRDVDPAEGAEHPPGDSGLAAQPLDDDADDRVVVLDEHLAERPEV